MFDLPQCENTIEAAYVKALCWTQTEKYTLAKRLRNYTEMIVGIFKSAV